MYVRTNFMGKPFKYHIKPQSSVIQILLFYRFYVICVLMESSIHASITMHYHLPGLAQQDILKHKLQFRNHISL